MASYTYAAKWPNGDIEELEVAGKDRKEADKAVRALLTKDYDKGWTIIAGAATPFWGGVVLHTQEA